MLGRLRPRSIYDVFALLALFVAVGGTGAYAANTVFSSDIVNGEVKSVDIGDNEIGSADVKDQSLNTFDVHSFIGEDVIDGTLTGADLQDGSVGAADLGGSAGVMPFVGRGHLTCSNCFIFNFRPLGFTNNLEPGASEDRPFMAPPGGLRVSDFVGNLTTTVPAGQAFNMWLIQFSTSNAFLTCSIPGGTSTCTAPGTATIPGGTLFWIVINTSYAVGGNPYIDFSFRARPAS
jgi:hypothetical protein